MKYTILPLILLITSCNAAPSANHQKADTTESVIITPIDSIDPNMPVQPMGTIQSNMPILKTDTNKIQPK